MTAPTTADATATASSVRRTTASPSPSAPSNPVQYTRATPRIPTSTMTPESIAHTGAGATACASASQKWKGTAAAFTRNPHTRSANATTTTASVGPDSRARPSCARLSAPVRA